MIMFWNRKEIYVGSSMKIFSEIRNILSANGIKYSYKVVNRNNSAGFSSNRARMGTFGEKSELAYQYYIYVSKDDYENAYGLINKH